MSEVLDSKKKVRVRVLSRDETRNITKSALSLLLELRQQNVIDDNLLEELILMSLTYCQIFDTNQLQEFLEQKGIITGKIIVN